MSASPATLAAARAEAVAIVRDRLHSILVALGEVDPYDTPRHAKPQEDTHD